MADRDMNKDEDKGRMTVQEAGKKGGEATSEKYDHEHFEEIGHKGGQKVKQLVEEGKKEQNND